ncbi:MAG: lipid II flippase MurJ, partial [Gammaproteobacteria bacterium]
IARAPLLEPTLTHPMAESSETPYEKTLNWGVRTVLLIGVPAAIGLAMLAEPMILTIFQHGSFTLEDANRSAMSLIAYSLGLPFFMLIKVLATAFYARQDTKTPVKIGIIAMLSNIVLNLLLYKPLGHVGLALATSISAILNAGLLYVYLRRNNYYTPSAGWLKYGLQLILACAALIFVILEFNPAIELWQTSNLGSRAFSLFTTITAAFVAFVVALFVSGVRWQHLTHKE